MTIYKRLLHLDTVFGTDNFDESFSTRQNGSGQGVTPSHSFNCRLNMTTPINNIKSISLKSVEIPFLAQNIRSTNKSNYIYFYVKYNNIENWISITLKDKQYTNISTLLGDINSAFSVKIATIPALAGFTIDFYLNPNDNSKIVIKANPDQITGGLVFGAINFYFSEVLTKHILGVAYSSTSANPDLFIGNVDTYSYMYCTNCYNLQPDNYFNLNFTNIESAPSNANGRPSTFKIPLDGNFGEVIYYNQKSGAKQNASIDRPNTNLSYLNMVITDRWGFPVYGFGSQISLTLNIEYEEIY